MALQPVHIVVVGIIGNAAHSLKEFQMAPERDASPLTDLYIGLKVNKADNTFTIIDSGIGMTNQDLADFVMNGKQNISKGFGFSNDGPSRIGVTFYTSSLNVNKVIVRTMRTNDCQYKCKSMADGSFNISRDNSAEQLHRGTEITLFLNENQMEYLEEEEIKDVVTKECGSIGYPIYLKVEKEPELNKGKIQEVAEEWQVIHEPKALGPSNNPMVANMVAEAGAKDPNVILCAAAKAHLRGKVDDAIMAEPGSFVADMPCQIKDGILEINPNNGKVKKLIEMVERGETVELAVELLYDNAIILNKPKKSVWNGIWTRMIGSLCCFISHGAVAAVGALESALDGDGDAYPF